MQGIIGGFVGAGVTIVTLVCLANIYSDYTEELATRCKAEYGADYALYSTSSNSSVKFCQSPNGELKAVPKEAN